MAEITAALVKTLRDKTGAGMMDCKKALSENNGDMDASVDWLRTKGLAAAAKKSDRIAAEGLVGLKVAGTVGAIVEVNSETDFVARNDQFQGLVRNVAEAAFATQGDEAAVLAATVADVAISDQITNAVATIGENMNLRRVATLAVEAGLVSGYVHNQVVPGMGKIGVLVALKSDASADKLEVLGKTLAMHIAAANPLSLNVASLDPEAVEREKQVQIEKARESGKADDIIMKMIDGRMRKYYEEVVLLEQISMLDGETKISKLIADTAKTAGSAIELVSYIRYGLGEGLEKKEDNFAAEVAAAVSR